MLNFNIKIMLSICLNFHQKSGYAYKRYAYIKKNMYAVLSTSAILRGDRGIITTRMVVLGFLPK